MREGGGGSQPSPACACCFKANKDLSLLRFMMLLLSHSEHFTLVFRISRAENEVGTKKN